MFDGVEVLCCSISGGEWKELPQWELPQWELPGTFPPSSNTVTIPHQTDSTSSALGIPLPLSWLGMHVLHILQREKSPTGDFAGDLCAAAMQS